MPYGANKLKPKAGWRTMRLMAAVAAFVTVATVTGIWAYMSHRKYVDSFMASTQKQLLSTSRSVAVNIEQYIDEHRTYLKVIALDRGVMRGLSRSEVPPSIALVRNINEANVHGMESIYLLDAKGRVVYRYPELERYMGKLVDLSDRPGISQVMESHAPYISEMFLSNSGVPSISMLEPVFLDGRFVGTVRWVIAMDYLMDTFLHPLRDTHGASVMLLQGDGRVLYQSESREHGTQLEEFLNNVKPGFDWSELAAIAGRMLKAGDGTGTYLAPDATGGAGRQLIGYSPVRLGPQTWSLGISMDYEPLLMEISEHTADTAMKQAAVMVALLIVIILVYNSEARKDELASRASFNEMLIREVHHRVKNNLMVVQSLLRLESKHITDEKLLSVFQESQNRIRSMGLIHEMLYSSRDVSALSTSRYLRELCGRLYENYALDPERIRLDMQIEDIHIDPERLVMVGLILNELVTNAFKYAFGEAGGVLHVSLKKTSAGNELVARDNGRGLPEGFDIARSDSMGMLVIRTLSAQIDGALSYGYANGAEFTITFP